MSVFTEQQRAVRTFSSPGFNRGRDGRWIEEEVSKRLRANPAVKAIIGGPGLTSDDEPDEAGLLRMESPFNFCGKVRPGTTAVNVTLERLPDGGAFPEAEARLVLSGRPVDERGYPTDS